RFRDCAEMAQELGAVIGIAKVEAQLPAAARQQAFERNVEQARRLFVANDLEGALEAARRAQALEPSRTGVVELIQQIEDRLADATTAVTARPRLPTEDLGLEPLARSEPPPAKAATVSKP